MPKRFTDTEKWKDQWYRKLPIKYKLFWNYILDNCDNSGLWKQDIDLASFQIGENINLNESIKILNSGKERIKSINNGEYLLIYTFISFQIGNIYQDKLTNLQKSAKALMFKHIENKGLKEEDFNFVTGKLPVAKEYKYKGIKDKGIDIKIKDTSKPKNSEEVTEYANSISFNLEGQKFIDYYEARGWELKKGQKVKDWKACVRTWKNNNKSDNKLSNQQNGKGLF